MIRILTSDLLVHQDRTNVWVKLACDTEHEAHDLIQRLRASDSVYQDHRLCYDPTHPTCLEHPWRAAECKAGIVGTDSGA